MFKKILVAVDGSKHALKAAKVACGIAAASEDASILLLTVTRQFKVTPQLKQYLLAENLMGEPKYVLDEMTEQILLEAKAIAKEARAKKMAAEAVAAELVAVQARAKAAAAEAALAEAAVDSSNPGE